MKTYLIEYICPLTRVVMSTHIVATDKTEARDLFFENFPNVTEVDRITWVPVISK